jgi:8-oxo-dGTP pyrophosphatase MutT (NUDIX family)
VIFLLREDDAVLLQHRDDKPDIRNPGTWGPPGGHQEPGESIEECALREFLEETGYHCKAINWLTSFQNDLDVNRDSDQSIHDITVFWAFYDEVQEIKCLEGQAMVFIERRSASDYLILPKIVELWDLAIAAASEHLDK